MLVNFPGGAGNMYLEFKESQGRSPRFWCEVLQESLKWESGAVSCSHKIINGIFRQISKLVYEFIVF